MTILLDRSPVASTSVVALAPFQRDDRQVTMGSSASGSRDNLTGVEQPVAPVGS
jgi:hypothetical protein